MNVSNLRALLMGQQPKLPAKAYLGDAVYGEVVDGMLKLTVEYGEGPVETIYLEPEVLENLMTYLSARPQFPERSEK